VRSLGRARKAVQSLALLSASRGSVLAADRYRTGRSGRRRKAGAVFDVHDPPERCPEGQMAEGMRCLPNQTPPSAVGLRPQLASALRRAVAENLNALKAGGTVRLYFRHGLRPRRCRRDFNVQQSGGKP